MSFDRGCEARVKTPHGRLVRCSSKPDEVTKKDESDPDYIGNMSLHDYCAKCSKNLCAWHLKNGRCPEGGKHQAANHGADNSP